MKYTDKDKSLDQEFAEGRFYVITARQGMNYVGVSDDMDLCQGLAVSRSDEAWDVSAYPYYHMALKDANEIAEIWGIQANLMSGNFEETVAAAHKRFIHQDTLHIARKIKEEEDKK